MLIMLYNRWCTGIWRVAAFFMAAFLTSLAPVFAQEDELIALMIQGKDPAPTLALEKEFAAAIQRDDRAWLAAKRTSIGPEFDRVSDILERMSEAEQTAFYIEYGAPCSTARLMMYAVVVKPADVVSEQPRDRNVRSAVPTELADLFAEYMLRCEVLKRLPRDGRLIGEEPL